MFEYKFKPKAFELELPDKDVAEAVEVALKKGYVLSTSSRWMNKNRLRFVLKP